MKRRDVIRGLGAASVTAVASAGGAAAARTAGASGGATTHDCVTWREDPDCRFDQRCSEVDCPHKCCDCLCLE